MKILRKKLIIIVILITILFSGVIFYPALKTYGQNILSKFIEKPVVVIIPIEEIILPGLPYNIKIPEIKVDAYVEHVGLTLDGVLDSPVDPHNAGWFNGGTIPGEIGSAVIDGHSGWKDYEPTVFDNLYKLRKGDKIFIESDTGVITTFVVYKLKTYDKDDEASDVFISTDKKAHLNLITCGGVWNEEEKGRESRVVVFAELENNDEI